MFHRATRMDRPGERITLVPGYIAVDTTVPDPTNVEQIIHWDEPGIMVELARHVAWLSSDKLRRLIENLPLSSDRVAIVSALHGASADIQRLIRSVESSEQDSGSTPTRVR